MKLSIPSIKQILDSIGLVTSRFPFVVTASILATIGAVLFVEVSFGSSSVPDLPLKLWLVGGLGISLLFSLAIFTEQTSWNKLIKLGVEASGFLLLVIYFFVMGKDVEHHPHQVWYQFALFGLVTHLFAACAPFLLSGNTDQFWEYNKSLFLRFLLSALYSGVLFVGLTVALASISELLEFEINGARYGQLFVILGGIFNTWFFLAGVPDKEQITTSELSFPLGLRRFAQYVLIPLVTVYIVILYLYLGKILIQWELPNGWVSNLVLTFSIAGILSLLLLYPIRESEENNWVRVYSKYYYLALIPLIGLLIFSIWVRISEYGVTVNRFFVATLGVWLTGIVVYFIVSKAKNIKVIPISLGIIVLAVSFGPLGAFSVSERSQLGRFEEILDSFGYLDENGKAQKSEEEIPFEDRKELSSIADYIVESHGFMVFSSIVNVDEPDSTLSAKNIMDKLGIDYTNRRQSAEAASPQYFRFDLNWDYDLDVSGFDIMLPTVTSYSYSSENSDRGGYEVSFDFETGTYEVYEVVSGHSIKVKVLPQVNFLLNNLEPDDSLTKEMAIVEVQDETWNVKVVITSVAGSKGDETELTSISSTFFIDIK